MIFAELSQPISGYLLFHELMLQEPFNAVITVFKRTQHYAPDSIIFSRVVNDLSHFSFIPQITKVRESVANNVKKDDIVIVLQHFDNDTTKAIEAFNAGKR